MGPVVRTWVALSVIGAALLHLAVATTDVGGGLAPRILLAACALVELTWAATSFAADRFTLPRAAPAVLLAPVVGWGLLVVAAAVHREDLPLVAPFAPLAVAAGLDLAGAAVVAVSRLRGRGRAPRRAADAPLRYLAALIVGVVVLAALAAPAIGAIERREPRSTPFPVDSAVDGRPTDRRP